MIFSLQKANDILILGSAQETLLNLLSINSNLFSQNSFFEFHQILIFE